MRFLSFLSFKRLRNQFNKLGSNFAPTSDSPDELLGELFQDVQLRRVFPDGMTFVDMVPAGTLKKILKAYKQQRQQHDFDLHKFVEKYFKDYLSGSAKDYRTNPNHTIEQHIYELWNVLTREAYKNKGSLVALPYPYIVPGGRFSAQWYWDSYFTMLGLAASGRYDLLEGMVKNYAFMIRKFGRIPQANRTYYLSRSQAPFFSHMITLLAKKQGKAALIKYLPYLLAEYRFWMKGKKQLSHDKIAHLRVVMMPDGEILNRYFDNKRTPRPESYKEDVDTALKAPDRLASKVYVDLRAAAESGWDFSSRWFKDGRHLPTIHTTDIVPIDLNCLLLHLEETIAKAYYVLKQGLLAERYEKRAKARAAAIRKYCWSPRDLFFFDYDFIAGERTGCYTLAGAFPLYVKMATQEEAIHVAQTLEEKFLKPGGLVTTLAETGQQWDAPNGWAPLHQVTIEGLRNYGFNDLANEIKRRWMTSCEDLYKREGKLVEKYNVIDSHGLGGGGEYKLQDGFGWTNGVYMHLAAEDRPPRRR